jgi:hypothetical protein
MASVSDSELLGKTPIAHPLAPGALPERALAQQLDGLPRDTGGMHFSFAAASYTLDPPLLG